MAWGEKLFCVKPFLPSGYSLLSYYNFKRFFATNNCQIANNLLWPSFLLMASLDVLWVNPFWAPTLKNFNPHNHMKVPGSQIHPRCAQNCSGSTLKGDEYGIVILQSHWIYLLHGYILAVELHIDSSTLLTWHSSIPPSREHFCLKNEELDQTIWNCILEL